MWYEKLSKYLNLIRDNQEFFYVESNFCCQTNIYLRIVNNGFKVSRFMRTIFTFVLCREKHKLFITIRKIYEFLVCCFFLSFLLLFFLFILCPFNLCQLVNQTKQCRARKLSAARREPDSHDALQRPLQLRMTR